MKIVDLFEAKKPEPPKSRSSSAKALEKPQYRSKVIPNKKKNFEPKHKKAVGIDEEKQRLDPKCWKGYRKQGTKMKGGVRVNNCVPIKEDDMKITDLVLENFDAEYNDESGMAKNSLRTIARATKGLYGTIGDGDNLPEWCQKKLNLAEDYLVTVWDYLQSEKGMSEAGSPTQQAAIAINMKKAGKKPKTEHLDEDVELNSKFDIIEEMISDWAQLHDVDEDVIWEDIESLDDEELLAEAEAWQTKKGKNKNGGLNKKGVASYRRSHPGSKLQTAVTTKPSKLKKGSKAAKRRKSFCARMRGMKKHRTGAKTKRDPNSRINKSLRKWNCE